jgi:L-ascorbate metabolism protein UlaG (beta-lactamase superfamily)
VSDRITYVGHATVRLDLAGTSLLTDPALRSRMLLRVIERRPPSPAAEVVAGLDAVLVSHLHPDHLDFPSLRRIGRDVPVVVPAGAGRTLRRRGFEGAIELAVGEATRIGAAEVGAVPADHDGRRYKLGPRVDAIGFEIRAGGRRLYFAGDTGLFDEMAELAGGLDVALLPIGGWGPKVGPRHLGPRRAARAAAITGAAIAIPIHWGTLLRAGLASRRPELLTDPPREFVARLAELAPETEPRVLAPGESLTLAGASGARSRR